MNRTAAIPSDDLAKLTGPQLMGMLFNWGLISTLSVQVYLYHIMFPDDAWSLRAFVYGIFVFEWVQTGLVTSLAFNKFVYHFGDVGNLVLLGNNWFSNAVMCGIVSVAVQLFYARRIWVLSKSLILSIIICALALMQGGAAIATGIMLKGSDQTNVNDVVPASVIWVWLVGSATVDISIAVAMTFLLLRTKTGIRRSDTMINKVVRLVVESGTVTATVAIVGFALFAAYPHDNYYICPALVLAKLYANTMLTSLNNRAFLQRMMIKSQTMSLAIPDSNRGRRGEPVFGWPPSQSSATDGDLASDTTVGVTVMMNSEGEVLDYPLRESKKASVGSTV